MSVSQKRTLSVHQEHELLMKLEAAGLNKPLAQAIIDSQDNVLAGVLMQLAGNAGITNLVAQDQWVERERMALEELAQAGLPKVDIDLVAAAWQPRLTFDHRFQPAGLTQQPLLAAAKAIGLKINQNDVIFAQFDRAESISTQAGTFEFNVDTFGRATDKAGRPFSLTYDEQREWAITQGGSDLWSVEEGLYNGWLRVFAELKLIPYTAGLFRSRNRTDSAGRLACLGWDGIIGLDINWDGRDFQCVSVGAGVRKFNTNAWIHSLRLL